MKKNAPKETTSPCNGCPKKSHFSVSGCVMECNDFKNHVKKVLDSGRSPCKDCQCGIPGATAPVCELRKSCRFLEVYLKRVGKGPKSALSREVIPPPDNFYKHWLGGNRNYR